MSDKIYYFNYISDFYFGLKSKFQCNIYFIWVKINNYKSDSIETIANFINQIDKINSALELKSLSFFHFLLINSERHSSECSVGLLNWLDKKCVQLY